MIQFKIKGPFAKDELPVKVKPAPVAKAEEYIAANTRKIT